MSTGVDSRFKKILFNYKDIEGSAKRIGRQIDHDYYDKKPLMVVVLKGAMMWASNLFRNISIDIEIDFINISSYQGGIVSTNSITLETDLTTKVKNRDVILVEDIVDTGLSLNFLQKLLKKRGVKTVSTATMLNKESGRKINVHADYIGFEIGDEFVAGYGLDYKEIWRNLPFVGVVNPKIYS